MMKMRECIITFFVVTVLFLPGIAGAEKWDLNTDWSETANGPVWTYQQGTYILPPCPDWTSGQFAWAFTALPAQGHVPTWLKAVSTWSTGGGQIQAGDIAFHPTSGASSYSYGEGKVTWTSPIDGTITITGNTWWGGYYATNDRRGVTWTLSLKEEQLASGTVFDLDTFSRGSPQGFGTFTRDVVVGDVLTFQGVTASGYNNPWFIGVNLTIDSEPSTCVPEPTSLLLLGGSLLGLVGFRLRKRA